jgi:hypothetical protein
MSPAEWTGVEHTPGRLDQPGRGEAGRHRTSSRVRRRYRAAKTIHLVMDNLNLHDPGTAVSILGAVKRTALWKRFTPHYTPKHGSWLNPAEIEASLWSRECDGRDGVDTVEAFRDRTHAWTARADRARRKVTWRFTTAKARRVFRYKGGAPSPGRGTGSPACGSPIFRRGRNHTLWSVLLLWSKRNMCGLPAAPYDVFEPENVMRCPSVGGRAGTNAGPSIGTESLMQAAIERSRPEMPSHQCDDPPPPADRCRNFDLASPVMHVSLNDLTVNRHAVW